MKVYISFAILAGLVALALSCSNPLDAKDCLTGYSAGDLTSLCKFMDNGQNITDCIKQKTDCIPSEIPEWGVLEGAAKTVGLTGSCNTGMNLQPVLGILLPSLLLITYRWLAN
ncbi:unnamed protein product [Owenia fusiformis]|uniref:Uncharacterized protein n=1 Tax=Owenia fusiformis TaxID=6347 RepID=A0A8J1XY44_OWEFU|nr:unnamed protein product [Owenia fusiformis]